MNPAQIAGSRPQSAGLNDKNAPTFAQYRQAAEFFDMAFKFENLIDGM
jgi:hypothetical protein